MADLQDQVALITGAGRGLGAAMALEFARQGAHVAVNDLSAEGAADIAKKVQSLGRKSLVSTHDVSARDQARALTDEVCSKLGPVTILVNNAGITRDAMLHKLSEELWDEVIRVNLKGPFNMGQACAEVMIKNKKGVILNISSVAWLGNIGQTNYSASKAGVVGMTRTWAVELARHGIRCNAIAPGLIESVLTRQVPDEIRQQFIKKIPLGRIGDPQDVANLAAFICSDRASYMTGEVIHLDGGLSTGI